MDSTIVCSLGRVIEGASIVVLESAVRPNSTPSGEGRGESSFSEEGVFQRDEPLFSGCMEILETPLQRPIKAKEIAWNAVMKPLIVHAAPGWEEMKRQIEECHLAAHLLLSEVSDFGVEAFSNARRNWREAGPFRNFFDLKGVCSKIPAVICGAGGSLLEAVPFLRESGALIFAAGSAFSQLIRLGVDPHAVCGLDKQMTPPEIFSEVPLFMQSRLNPEVVSRFRGEKVLVPESGPLSWERWWLETAEEVSCGWTVGNFALKIALFLGCDPIILTGMDYCYCDGKKYALDQEKKDVYRNNLKNRNFDKEAAQNFLPEREIIALGQGSSEVENFDAEPTRSKTESSGCFGITGTVEALNRLGDPVLTQRDWLMAARFCDDAAKEYCDRRIISTAVKGLSLGDRIEVKPFAEIELSRQKFDLQSLIRKTSGIDFQEKEEAWNESLLRCGTEEDLSGEPVYDTVLEPLWRIWRPLFEREAEGQSMELHRRLFFQKVLFFFSHHAEGSGKECSGI